MKFILFINISILNHLKQVKKVIKHKKLMYKIYNLKLKNNFKKIDLYKLKIVKLIKIKLK